MSFNKDALLHKLQDEADKWEEIPDEDLWQDGEIKEEQLAWELFRRVVEIGDWKLIRRKSND